MFSMFLMLTLYMQQVLGYSAMGDRRRLPAVAGTAIIWSAVAAQLVTRIGVKPVLTVGMTMLTGGLVHFTRSPSAARTSATSPGFLLIGIGIGFSFVPISIAALAGVQPAGGPGLRADQHLAAGRRRARHRRARTIATSQTSDAVAFGAALDVALVDGFTAAFLAGVIIAGLGIVAALRSSARTSSAVGVRGAGARPRRPANRWGSLRAPHDPFQELTCADRAITVARDISKKERALMFMADPAAATVHRGQVKTISRRRSGETRQSRLLGI